MKRNSARQDYHNYEFTGLERVGMLIRALLLALVLAYFFYRSAIAVLPLLLVSLAYLKGEARKKGRRRREALLQQFRECILSVSGSLYAGYAVENAFLESREDIRMLYGEEADMYRELELIRRGLVLNIPLEELLEDLAARSGLEELLQFAGTFAIAKRSGGNIAGIIRSNAEQIGQKNDLRKEIRTILSGRLMEQNIMRIMPFGILFYIERSYPGYFDMLYHNLQGVGIMTAGLALYFGAYALGEYFLAQIEKGIG